MAKFKTADRTAIPHNTKRYETSNTGKLSVTGHLTTTGGEIFAGDDVAILDNKDAITFGAGADLKIDHDGTDSRTFT